MGILKEIKDLVADIFECRGSVFRDAHIKKSIYAEKLTSNTTTIDSFRVFVAGSTEVYVNGRRMLRKESNTESADIWDYEENNDRQSITFRNAIYKNSEIYIEYTDDFDANY